MCVCSRACVRALPALPALRNLVVGAYDELQCRLLHARACAYARLHVCDCVMHMACAYLRTK